MTKSYVTMQVFFLVAAVCVEGIVTMQVNNACAGCSVVICKDAS